MRAQRSYVHAYKTKGILFALALLAAPARAQERITFFLNDALGSPVVALDVSGATVWRGDYDPFGGLIAQSGAITTTRRWLGAQFDAESGLLLMGRRYYHAGIGRFLSPDPALIGGLPPTAVTLPARLNAYAYGMNNPLRFMDPTGAFAIESKPLQESKEFKEAMRLIASTREGRRILWALDFADVNVVVFDAPLSVIRSGYGRVTFGRQVPLLGPEEWDHVILIDYGFIHNMPDRRSRIRAFAATLYHELRHAEIDVETWDFDPVANVNLQGGLDPFQMPFFTGTVSLDFRERRFQEQLEKELRPRQSRQ